MALKKRHAPGPNHRGLGTIICTIQIDLIRYEVCGFKNSNSGGWCADSWNIIPTADPDVSDDVDMTGAPVCRCQRGEAAAW